MNARRVLVGLCIVLCIGVSVAAQTPVTVPGAAQKPVIQIAVLLDTSNSMDGLIEQAKTQLWKIVNEFIAMRRNGMRPEIQVALYQYGNDGLPASEGWMRMMLPLSTDLDRVSKELFTLRTNGGTECCGWVIREAVKNLSWSPDRDALKVILIAGNEPFTQGNVDFRESCKAAASKGIVVNTIHCGSLAEGVNGKWKDGADLADGKYLVIDSNQAVVSITAPQDAELAHLSAEINTTYVPYGANGAEGAKIQHEQETNAATSGPSSTSERAVTKGSQNYQNERWDLVDAVRRNAVKLEDVKAEELPEPMRKMDKAARKAYVEEQQKKRDDIQKQINDLGEARKKFIAEETKKQAEKGADTFDTAVIKAVREQAASRDFKTE